MKVKQMASVVREFEDINESRVWLKQIKPKSGQHIKIEIIDDVTESNDDWKQALRGIFGMWKDDPEAIIKNSGVS